MAKFEKSEFKKGVMIEVIYNEGRILTVESVDDHDPRNWSEYIIWTTDGSFVRPDDILRII